MAGHKATPRHWRVQDLAGKVFGRLTAVEYAGRNKRRSSLWRCLCACGTECVVSAQDLKSGNKSSCGCLRWPEVQEQLLRHIERKPGGCWEWTGKVHKETGYGRVTINQRERAAHRVAYEVWVGPIPDGLFVCHHCDNEKCICPDHLFVGTTGDNMRDCTEKNRCAHGVRQHCSKLSPDAVRQMRMRYAAGGISLREVGALFGVTAAAARNAICRKTWRRVTDEDDGNSLVFQEDSRADAGP